MVRWAYAQAAHKYGEGRTSLITTEPSVVVDVFHALQQLIPSARVSLDPNCSKLGVSYAEFDRLDGMDDAVRLCIVAELCELGWEPFGIEGGDVALRKALPQ